MLVPLPVNPTRRDAMMLSRLVYEAELSDHEMVSIPL
jgi:hypothetical protein